MDTKLKANPFDELMALRGGTPPVAGEVTVTGADPVYPTVFRVGDTAAAVIAGIGVAVNDLWESKTGRRQQVAVDTRHAAATMRTADFTYFRDATGKFEPAALDPQMQRMRQRTQPWPTRDGRWFLPHLNLPDLSARVLGVLKCENTVEGVRDAVAQWNADDLEDAIAAARACGGKVRTNAEWMAHPQGQYLAGKPLIEIEKIGDTVPIPMKPGERPLTGIRALDLTRILAGPVAARTLAEHGAEVLMVTAKHLPQTPEHVRDTSHGKRSCILDLNQPAEAATLKALVRDADVFSQGYRPGVLAARGFGPEDLARLRPGIVVLTISCYGSGGPFASRAGWEQVAQTVTGICHANGSADSGATGKPTLIHAAACDWITGYLGAYGVLLALTRRAREGGSYHVRVSLCQSGMFIQRQGQGVLDTSLKGLPREEAERLQIEADSPYGRMRFLRPALQMSETQPYWAKSTPKLGGDEAKWVGA